MAIVSRLELDHPALGTAGGSSLHTSIENIYVKVGDAINSRFFTEDALPDANFVVFDHNFKTAFSQIRFILFLRDTGTGELTRINAQSTPPIDDFTIAATAGNLTTQVTVTNNSGAARDIALVAIHEGGFSGWNSRVEASAYTAVNNDQVFANTSGGAFAVTLPASPVIGDKVRVLDYDGSFGTNACTIGRNGNTIMGAAADMTLSTDNMAVEFIYNGADWRIIV
jgi:hypothetical protein